MPKTNIFESRVNFKPYEYPEILEFKDAIRHSYWIHTEFNVTSDIQDFKVNIKSQERDVIKKTMLAISQIEISVKTFWAKIYDRMPKPEIGAVGMTFAESEIRHADAYAFLLERLGLNKEFEGIHDIPAIIDRVNYLQKHISGVKSRDDKKFALSVLLFSIFIEHVSLFSQFLIMMSFNKHKNLFKGISNIVEATSKEEDKAEKAEEKVLDWIFEKGELDFLPKEVVVAFIRDRFNRSLGSIDIEPIFEVDEELLSETKWFDEELSSTKDNDFFNKRSTTYSKKQKSITEDDLF
jgi:ribonucleoside-diphosphate reductase beta chain